MLIVALIIAVLALWYVWKNQNDDYMETDPTVVRLKRKLMGTFPQLANVRMIKSDASYTINKSKIYLCTEFGGKRYDDNMLTYVILHELAHVETPEIGHGPAFMKAFNGLLAIAAANGLWDPNEPRIEKYCKS
jgi:predicted metal-dependent hydrolase